jgi:outer membrane protein assembly factor BamB
MTEEFTYRLRMQVREAALREERRGALSRALLSARPRPAVALGAFAAAVAAGVAILFSLFLGAGEPESAAPRVVANVAVADQLAPGPGRTAFGSVWLSDASRGAVIRVDARTRRVTARIPVGGEASIEVGGGSVWALARPSRSLVRIDPRTNRVMARVALGQTFAQSTLAASRSRVWAIGLNGAAAVDPGRDRVVARIRYSAAGFQVIDAFVRGRELWLTSSDGIVNRYDARTGRPLGRLPWKTGATLYPFGDELVAVGGPGSSVALVDARTGRARWRSRVAGEIHAADVVRGRVYLAGTDAGGRERFWALEARTGRSLGTVAVPGFSVSGLRTVGGDVWLPTLGGRVVIVAP